jgi:hypothetical protein
MARFIVPTKPIPNQTLQAQLGGQACTLNIYQLAYGMFMDVEVGTTRVTSGVICQNLNRIVRSAYLGFIGDFVWADTQGTDDPVYTGLNSRFLLVYMDPDSLAASMGS